MHADFLYQKYIPMCCQRQQVQVQYAELSACLAVLQCLYSIALPAVLTFEQINE